MALSLATSLSTTSLFAQDSSAVHPWLEDSFVISLGGFLPDKEFKIRVDGEAPGQDIDFNRVAGVSKDEATGAMNFRWKFGEKWSASGQYWATDDSRTAVLDEDVTWGDNVLQAGSNIEAGAGLDLIRAFVGREFFTDEDYHEFGLGAGIHWMEIEAYMEGEMFVNGETNGVQRESVEAGLPLPNVGAWYWRSLSPRWLITSNLDWFSASFDEYSGSLWDAGVGVNFQAWDHVGFGLSYQYFKVDVDVDKSDWQGNAEITQHGPFLAVSFNW